MKRWRSLKSLNEAITRCRLCPRLVRHREWVAANRPRRYSNERYWARPLPGFGDTQARLLILGLAPAAHGGNRTGRMFTGDSAGNTLMRALYEAGFANKPLSERRDDGLELRDAYITATIRCPPPDNKPTPEEMRRCEPYLIAELTLLKRVKVVVALGRIAFEAYLRILRGYGDGVRYVEKPVFAHGACYTFVGYLFGKPAPSLIASYHPSRQNTQTGRLTPQMLSQVFIKARELIMRSPS